ncbi:MAG: patatin-like phospholipase family protein [Anaerolineaceae bacterium]
MKTKRALVLSSGGSRGALQVGAIRALFEMGYSPDLITGASIGAANAAFLAVNGFNKSGIEKLQSVWETTIDKDLLPTDLWWQIIRAFLKRTRGFSLELIQAFAIANGLTPDLCFRDLDEIKLYLVASDLGTGFPVIFGSDPDESVLESVLASMALPPWIAPIERDGHFLVDGGAVSNLPIEAALLQGATEIIALDLSDLADGSSPKRSISNFFMKLDCTVESRQKNLELELAEARGVPVKCIVLTGDKTVPFWDFRQSLELMQRGYQLTYLAMEGKQIDDRSSWINRPESRHLLESILDVFD